MIVLVLFLSLFSSLSYALVPIESLLLGQADQSLQTDSFEQVFNYTPQGDIKKESIKLIYGVYQEGLNLVNSCDQLSRSDYFSSNDKSQAYRHIISTLQYIGLDRAVKNIGRLGSELDYLPDEFARLADNLVKSSCSPNLSVYGHELIRTNLNYYFDHPKELAVNIPKSMVNPSANLEFKRKELHYSLALFQSLCSWGGNTRELRLLPHLLSNPFIMDIVFKNILGQSLTYDKFKKRVVTSAFKEAVSIRCDSMICRRTTLMDAQDSFPRAIGSTGLNKDLQRLYCYELADLKTDEDSFLQDFKIERRDYDYVMEEALLLSLLIGTKNFLFTINNSKQIEEVVGASFFQFWEDWAFRSMRSFSNELLFEEALELKTKKQRNVFTLNTSGFKVTLTAALGELDKLFDGDKLDVKYNLQISKNYLRWLRKRWKKNLLASDPKLNQDLTEEFIKVIQVNLDFKQAYLHHEVFTGHSSRLVAKEILEQLNLYQGDMFDSLEDELLEIPVQIQVGVYAMSYLHYYYKSQNIIDNLDLGP